MIVRKGFEERIFGRSWGKLSRGVVIVKRFNLAAPNGFLNAVKSVSYTPEEIKGCDIWLASMRRKETRVGVEVNADALVWMDRAASETLGENDVVNIGGVIQGGSVLGGSDFHIKDIDAYDSLIGDKVKISLERL